MTVRAFVSGLVAVLLVSGLSEPAYGQAIGSDHLVVLQVSNRTVSTSQGVSLIEYSIGSGLSLSPVRTIAVPSLSTDANRFAIVGSTATAGGALSYNPNGTVTFAGYRAATGDAQPNNQAASTVNRVIGVLDLSTGTTNTNISMTNSFSTQNFRSVATFDNQHFYMSGANGTSGQNAGQQLLDTGSTSLPGSVTAFGTTSGLTTAPTSNNTRQIQVVGGNVFIASGNNPPGQQIFQVGTGTPTTGGQALTASFGNQSSAYNSFALARLGTGTSWNGTGYDTVYAVDNASASGATVQKFTFNGSTWSAAGSIGVANANHISIRVNGASSVDMFVTTSASGSSAINGLTDTSGIGGSLSGTFIPLVTNSGNEGFYGVANTPVPEPATTFAVVAGFLGAVGFARRRIARSAPAA
jgi:hypothetical protein